MSTHRTCQDNANYLELFVKFDDEPTIFNGDVSNPSDVDSFRRKQQHYQKQQRFKSQAVFPSLVSSISTLAHTKCKRLPGLVSLVSEHLAGISDVGNIVVSYYCQPLVIQVDMLNRGALEVERDYTKKINVVGCDYVTIFIGEESITMPYENFPQFFHEFNSVYSTALNAGYEMLEHIFQIQFHGNITVINFFDFLHLKSVVSFPTSPLTKVCFSLCSNLMSVPSELPQTVVDLSECFQRTHTPRGFENWDVSRVRDLSFCFANCLMNRPLYWNPKSALTARDMFHGASHFNKQIVLNFPELRHALYMFYNTTNLKEPVIIRAPNLCDIHKMFSKQTANKGKIFIIAGSSLKVDDLHSFLSYSIGKRECVGSFKADPAAALPQNPNKYTPCILHTKDVVDVDVDGLEIKLDEAHTSIPFPGAKLVLPQQPGPQFVVKANRFGRKKKEPVTLDTDSHIDIMRSSGVLVSSQYLDQPCNGVLIKQTEEDIENLKKIQDEIQAIVKIEKERTKIFWARLMG